MPYSNALQCRRKRGRRVFRRPAGAMELDAQIRPGPRFRQLARETGIAWPCRNPYTSIVARALEMAYAVDEALRLIEAYEPPEVARHCL